MKPERKEKGPKIKDKDKEQCRHERPTTKITQTHTK